MKRKTVIGMIFAVSLGCAAVGCAQNDPARSPSSIIRLDRDPAYEQNLKYLASADTAITPERVLRWMNSLMGHTPETSTSNVEFQPILRVHDSQKQVIAQLAYTF